MTFYVDVKTNGKQLISIPIVFEIVDGEIVDIKPVNDYSICSGDYGTLNFEKLRETKFYLGILRRKNFRMKLKHNDKIVSWGETYRGLLVSEFVVVASDAVISSLQE